MALNQEQIRNLWMSFISGVYDPRSQLLRKEVVDSWERCLKLQVDPNQKVISKTLSPLELKLLKEKNAQWIEIALPVMEAIYSFVKGSGFVVAIADNHGYLLDVIGDGDVERAIKKGNFVPGADWSEKSAGTNSVGTSIILNEPIQIIGYEHFCRCSHKWTCSAAPIHDNNGEIIGVLDMTGSVEKAHSHTLGMVVAGAYAIERELAIKKASEERDLAFKIRDEMMESISEGIIAVDVNKNVIHLNLSAAKLLQLSKDILNSNICNYISSEDKKWEEIISGITFVTDREMDLKLNKRFVRVMLTSRAIRNSSGHIYGVVMVFNEISRARKITHKMSGAIAKFTFSDMIGNSNNFLNCLRIAKSAANSDSTVLILGESGTGKDILAQAIHNESARSSGPFVAINCAVIPRDLIGSELFGYAEGAFTGAKRGGSPGKFELADGGTIFLDEIGDLPLNFQSALLRVLEDKTIIRVGGTRVLPVNVRVIAATNKDLENEVNKGNFRKDLFYRLNVITLKLPPLRERKTDIVPLFDHFLNLYKGKLGKNILTVSKDTYDILKKYSWPGNIRELQNVAERSLHVISGNVLEPEHLPEEIRKENLSSSNDVKILPIKDYEKITINTMLRENIKMNYVAKALGISRATLYRKLSKYGIQKTWTCTK